MCTVPYLVDDHGDPADHDHNEETGDNTLGRPEVDQSQTLGEQNEMIYKD